MKKNYSQKFTKNFPLTILCFLMMVNLNAQCVQLPGNLTNGLVAYYPFCGNANDVSGNNNNGTVNNATLTTDRFGIANSAYSFNGNNSYIDCGNSNILHITGNLTMGGWIYMDGGSGNPRMLSTESPEGNYRIASSGTSNTSRTVSCNYGNTYLSVVLNATQWYHLIYTYENGRVRLYVNGVKVDDQNITQTETRSFDNPLNIGRKAAPAYDTWGGKLDDIILYNRALSDAEISQLYNVGNADCLQLQNTLTNGLLAYYPFCGNANDESGNGNNGTVNGATLVQDRNGASNSAYLFDGVSNNITTNFLPPTGNKTRSISAWVKNNAILPSQGYSILAYGANSPYCNQGGGNFGFELFSSFGDFGDAKFRLRLDGNCSATYTTNTIDTNWHNVVVVFDSTLGNTISSVILYIDGVLQTQLNYFGNTIINTLNLSNLKIGVSVSTGIRYFNGILDDIGIWNRALNNTEIVQLYNSGTVLPIHLTSFVGNEKEGEVELKWQSENETNVSHFDVEYSIDGVNFKKIAAVSSLPNNNLIKTYNYLHHNPQQEYNFYRLKQVDKDGSFTYSSIVKVQAKKIEQTIIVYPNPVKDIIWVSLKKNKMEKVNITITDMMGRVVLLEQRQLLFGNNTFSINISLFIKGVYQLSVSGTEGKQTLKIIKQ